MVVARTELKVVDGSTTYNFPIIPTETGGKAVRITTKEWEPGDPVFPWRKALHPFDAGLTSSKLANPRGYIGGMDSTIDASYDGFLVPSPKVTSPTMPTAAVLSVIQFRAQASNTFSAATSVVVDKPTGTVDNDVLILVVTINVLTAITATGWTLVQDTDDGATHRIATYRKTAATEGANYTISFGAASGSAIIATYIGVDTAAVVNASNENTTASSTSHTTASITPNITGCRLITVFSLNNGASSWTAPSGMIERKDLASTYTTSIDDVQYDSTSAITKTGTSAAAATGLTHIIALNALSTAPSLTGTNVFNVGMIYNSLAYFGAGRYLYKMSAAYAVTTVKDFGTSKRISTLTVFENELVITFLTEDYLWTMTTAEVFTESPTVLAIASGTEGKKHWVAQSNNKLLNCITGAGTLTNYAPASPNQYTVGDSGQAIIDIIDFAGQPYVIKPEGVFAPDFKADFQNQTPQITYPHSSTGKRAWRGFNSLWVPTVSGTIQVTPGESKLNGPEDSHKPEFLWRVRHGVQYGNAMYVLADDGNTAVQTMICKVVRDTKSLTDNEFIYHELAWVANNQTAAEVILAFPNPTNPSIVIGQQANLRYFKLGRGSTRYIDDTNYLYEASWGLYTGLFSPVESNEADILATLVGAKIVMWQPGTTYQINQFEYSIDGRFSAYVNGSFTSMLTTQEGGGTEAITGTVDGPLATFTRYASIGATGQLFGLRLSGAITGAPSGITRLEIRELWAFGFLHPKVLDLVTITLNADVKAKVRGLLPGRSPGTTRRLFSNWKEAGTVLQGVIRDYEESRTTRFIVVGVEANNLVTRSGSMGRMEEANAVTVTLARVDYASAFADA